MPMPMVVCESDAIGDAIGVATRERETRDAKADVWRARGRRVGARRRRPRRAHRDATFESTDTQKKRFFFGQKTPFNATRFTRRCRRRRRRGARSRG
jgi:hypothetical protein